MKRIRHHRCGHECPRAITPPAFLFQFPTMSNSAATCLAAKIFAASNVRRSLRRSGGIYARHFPPSTPNFAKNQKKSEYRSDLDFCRKTLCHEPSKSARQQTGVSERAAYINELRGYSQAIFSQKRRFSTGQTNQRRCSSSSLLLPQQFQRSST